MSLEVNVHAAQTAILRELLFRPQAGYAELQRPTGLMSDHFNFHVVRLVDLGLVQKVVRGKYKLTPKGKEYANKLDTDQNTIERQPKCAVMLCIEKEIKGARQFLLQERLKHPYFGFWGVPTGKIRWGETILQTAARELMEETGLEADFRYVGVYHEHAYQKESGELLEDKIFHVVHCQNPRGKLTETFEGGRNEWMTKAQAEAQQKKFDSVTIELGMVDKEYAFVENIVTYAADQF
jgi:ADP-ribose pyrophosphatase YjhB (NUDIX family)